MTRLSGWCSGHNGCTSQRAHETCDDRLTKGLLNRCDCTEWDGHQKPESLSTTVISTPKEV